MRDTGAELASLGRAPLAAAATVLCSGLVLATAVSLAASTDALLLFFLVAFGALALALLAALRVAFLTRPTRSSVASIIESLDTLAEGRSATELAGEGMGNELVAAYRELANRFAAAEKLAKVSASEAREIDGERLAFLADFSHELRTPLNSILGFAHVLDSESEGPLDADGREAVGIILASGEQLSALIEDLLDLTALETGKLELRPRPVDLGRLVDEVAHAARIVAAQKSLPLQLDCAARVMATGDEKRLRRMLWNIVARAIRATEKGSIRISVVGPSKSEARATISVEDDGRSMSPAEKQALLTGHTEESTSRENIGIGLGVVGRLVRLHKGTIAIETRDGGSRVEVKLPHATADEVSWAIDNRPSLIGTSEKVERERGGGRK